MLAGMVARARPSSPAPLAAGVVALAMAVAACSSHDTRPAADPATTTTSTTSTTVRPEPPSDPRLRELAERVGCSATAPVDRRDGVAGAVLCEVDGRTGTRIQVFAPSDRPAIERRFAGSLGDGPGGGVECDGETYEFVVLGDDWLVATDDPTVAGGLVVSGGGGLVGPDGEPPADPETPDVCR
jgi:hypothetical protein